MNTATNDRLGQGAWSVGPSAVFLKMTGAWVAGGVVSNVWSVSEESGRANVVRPDDASKWQIRGQFVLMFPK